LINPGLQAGDTQRLALWALALTNFPPLTQAFLFNVVKS